MFGAPSVAKAVEWLVLAVNLIPGSQHSLNCDGRLRSTAELFSHSTDFLAEDIIKHARGV